VLFLEISFHAGADVHAFAGVHRGHVLVVNGNGLLDRRGHDHRHGRSRRAARLRAAVAAGTGEEEGQAGQNQHGGPPHRRTSPPGSWDGHGESPSRICRPRVTVTRCKNCKPVAGAKSIAGVAYESGLGL